MSTTDLTAGTVMDRAASLMNDTARTTYTYTAQLPYLNMAIDELLEELQIANNSPTNKQSSPITLAIGEKKLTPAESVTTPHYPSDLVEVRKIGERLSGTNDAYTDMVKKDFLGSRPATETLIEWAWINQEIVFYGATSIRQLQIDYVAATISLAASEVTVIGTINARSFLAYKTAALCAQFIGENPTRAKELEDKAQIALDRLLGVGAKGRQSIYTRRRPFRAAFKQRAY